eukprot:gene561-3878_t
MFSCTPACLPARLHVCLHVCMFACTSACLLARLHACMFSCTPACLPVRLHVCLHVCMFACTSACARVPLVYVKFGFAQGRSVVVVSHIIPGNCFVLRSSAASFAARLGPFSTPKILQGRSLFGRHILISYIFPTTRFSRQHSTIQFSMEISWSYKKAINTLNSLQTNASALEKQRRHGIDMTQMIPAVQDCLRRINVTQENLKRLNVIHIAGSKGKGSVAAFAESVLRNQGYKTGLFTSPHLIEVRERIRINGIPISQQQFAHNFQILCQDLDSSPPSEGMSQYPTYFKATFLLAMKVFLAEKVDVAIVEVGLGGLYDATNVIESPVVCGITHIGLEHTSILGDTLSKIAHQKCGILKQGIPSFVTPQEHETLVEFRRSKELRKPLCMHLVPSLSSTGDAITLGLSGEHQKVNAALAIQLTRTWQTWMLTKEYGLLERNPQPSQDILPEVILDPLSPAERDGLSTCRWPGRAQVLQRGDVIYLIDGAHTPESCAAMTEWLRSIASPKLETLQILMFNCTGDRNPSSLLSPILEKSQFDMAIFCPNVASLQVTRSDQMNFNISANATQRMQRRAREAYIQLSGSDDSNTKLFDCIEDSINYIASLASPDHPVEVTVTGSLHLVGGVLAVLGAEVT